MNENEPAPRFTAADLRNLATRLEAAEANLRPGSMCEDRSKCDVNESHDRPNWTLAGVVIGWHRTGGIVATVTPYRHGEPWHLSVEISTLAEARS